MIKHKKNEVTFKTPKINLGNLISIPYIITLGTIFLAMISPKLLLPTAAYFAMYVISFIIHYLIIKCDPYNTITINNDGFSFSYREPILWDSIKRIERKDIRERKQRFRAIILHYLDEKTNEIKVETAGISQLYHNEQPDFERMMFRYYNKKTKEEVDIDPDIYGDENIYRTFKSLGVSRTLFIPTCLITFVSFMVIMIKYEDKMGPDPRLFLFISLFLIPTLVFLYGIFHSNSYYVALKEKGIDIAGKRFIPWEHVRRVEYRYSLRLDEAFPKESMTLYHFDPRKDEVVKKKLKSRFFNLDNPEELEMLINHHIKKQSSDAAAY